MAPDRFASQVAPPTRPVDYLAVVGTALIAGLLAWWVATLPTSRPDFAILWAAPQLPTPYDYSTVGRLLHWGIDDPPATFVYPPSALPLFALFAEFEFAAALTGWAALSGAALALSSRSRWAPLLIFTPPVLWALPGGQTSVMMGALAFCALQSLHRPRLGGVLLGVALSVKPQLVFLIPVALLLTRQWQVLVTAILTFAIMTLCSAFLFGWEQWIVWLTFLPDYLLLHENNPNLRSNEIAFGLAGWIRGLALIVGATLTWRAARHRDPVTVFVLATCTALVVSPHAMGYEFAVLSPVYARLMAGRGWSASAILLLILTPFLVWAFGSALLLYMPRLIALVCLMAAIVADRQSKLFDDFRFGGAARVRGNAPPTGQ